MEQFQKWIDAITKRGLLCESYKEKVANAKCKKDLFDIVTDANGMTFIMEMNAKGFPLDAGYIMQTFPGFINGKCVTTHQTESGRAYTSAIYVKNKKPVVAETTLLTFIDCQCHVRLPENSICKIYCDADSAITIETSAESEAIVEYWGKYPPEIVGEGKVKTRHNG